MQTSKRYFWLAVVILTAVIAISAIIYGEIYHTKTIDILGNPIPLNRISSVAGGLQLLSIGLAINDSKRPTYTRVNKYLCFCVATLLIFISFLPTADQRFLAEKAKLDKYAEDQKRHDEEIRTTAATPLMLAAMNDNVDELKSLLDKGADVNEKNKYGFVALDYAAGAIPPYFQDTEGHINPVNALLEHGAHPDDAGEHGISPLMSAASNGDKDMSEALLEHGANINYVSMYGWTALSEAVMWQKEEITSFLLAHGADPNVMLENGHHNLLKMAKQKGNQKIIDMLEKAGAKES